MENNNKNNGRMKVAEWRGMVKQALLDIQNDFTEIKGSISDIVNELTRLKIDVARLQIKAGIWGAIAGLIPGLAAALYFLLRG